MAKIKLEIVSPDKLVYSADIDMLIVRSNAGELGFLPGHAPLVAGLLPHAMRIKIDDNEELIAVSGGFVEVQPEKISVLATAAELPVNIDVNRAKEAYDRAQALIDDFHKEVPHPMDIDYQRAQVALQRAVARLRATRTNIEK